MYNTRHEQLKDKLKTLSSEFDKAVDALNRSDYDEVFIQLKQMEIRSRAIRSWIKVAAEEEK